MYEKTQKTFLYTKFFVSLCISYFSAYAFKSEVYKGILRVGETLVGVILFFLMIGAGIKAYECWRSLHLSHYASRRRINLYIKLILTLMIIAFGLVFNSEFAAVNAVMLVVAIFFSPMAYDLSVQVRTEKDNGV